MTDSGDHQDPRSHATPLSDPEGSQPGGNLPGKVPGIEQGLVGVIPGFWGAESIGPFTATLTFRVGEADERLRTRGRCHLVRALVLDGLETPDVRVSASITTLQTSFTVAGHDDAAAAALTSIVRRLTTLRTDYVDDVIPGIVDSWHPPAQWDTKLMSLRFGSRGYGLPATPLLGLDDIDVDAFSEWVRLWFNAENAVLSANRRPPPIAGLESLGDGTRKPLPPPYQLDWQLPAIARGAKHQMAVSFLSRFDATAAMMHDLLLERIHARCRMIDERIPPPESVARRTGSGLATVNVCVTAPDESLTMVRDATSSELFGLSMNGPDEDEVDRARIILRRARRPSSNAGYRMVEQRAIDHLFGEDRHPEAALYAEAPELAKVIRDAVPRAIWLLPVGVAVPDKRLTPIRIGSRTPIQGETYLPVAAPGGQPGRAQLVLSDEAVAITGPTGATTAVRFADLVAVQAHPDGARTLWNVDGANPRIDPAHWENGDRLGALIDARVDPWVRLESREELPTRHDRGG